MGGIQTLADVLALIRRRMLPMLAVVLGGTLVTLFGVLQTPYVFETAAVLQVELPRVSTEAASGDAVSRSAQRLQLLEQELTSRDSMTALIARHGLFADAPALTAAERVVALRRAIRFETVRAGQNPFGGDQPVSAMLIVVQLGRPDQAAAVANDLAQGVLDLTAQKQSERVRETLEFYEAEDRRLGVAIAALEAEITAFKNANVDALPEGMQARREEIGRVDATLRDLDLQLLDLRQELAALVGRGSPRAIEQRQITALEGQISGLEGQRRAALDRRAEVEAAVNRAPNVETTLGTFARRLQQLQDQYSVITRRRAEAETSQRLDSERQTERFHLLESALPPDYPLASGRRRMMVFGVFGSLMLALGLAVALELRNPVLRSARQMQRVLDLRPVIALPELPTPQSRRRSWGRRVLALGMVGGAAAAALALRGIGQVQMRLAGGTAARRRG
ncbi:MAG: hypothetical protein Q8K20_10695 [Gemmobacter sp.]|nr:hypothetical protein [Gemmobacter sp.]